MSKKDGFLTATFCFILFWTFDVNSLARMIRVLDQFDAPPGHLTVEQLHASLGYSRSTLYRYLKVLSDFGLIASDHGSGFTLGPRIIELNALIQSRDPLILASTPVMETLVSRYHGTALLCRRFRDKVLCVHQVADEGAHRPAFEVGRTRRLTQGAAARIVLAHVGPSQLRRLYAGNEAEFAQAGLGDDLSGVRRSLRRIRDRGFDCEPCISGNGALAVAAPIFDGGASVVGSLTLLLPQTILPEDRIDVIGSLVIRFAEEVRRTIG